MTVNWLQKLLRKEKLNIDINMQSEDSQDIGIRKLNTTTMLAELGA